MTKIEDVDFWQVVMDMSYLMDGEPERYQRQKMTELLAWCNSEHTDDDSLEQFRREAVIRLLDSVLQRPVGIWAPALIAQASADDLRTRIAEALDRVQQGEDR